MNLPTNSSETKQHNNTEFAIDARRINKRFGSVQALEQVDFCVPKGIVCGLLGPNGAGKTTLLRCMTGAIPVSFGEYKIMGHDPSSVAGSACFSFLPDFAPMEPELRLEEYLSLHARLRGITKNDIPARINECLEAVGLQEQRRALVGTLSRGQSSRAGFAECLLHRPDVLILDEPSAGLDPAQVRRLRELIRSLAGKHTILLATHHLPDVAAVCDHIVILVNGRIRYESPMSAFANTEELEKAYLHYAGAEAE